MLKESNYTYTKLYNSVTVDVIDMGLFCDYSFSLTGWIKHCYQLIFWAFLVLTMIMSFLQHSKGKGVANVAGTKAVLPNNAL